MGRTTAPDYEWGGGTVNSTILGTLKTFPQDAIVYDLVVYVPEESLQVRAALYADDGSGTKPAGLIFQAGPVDAGAGWNMIDVADIPVTAGTYWLAFQIQNGSYSAYTSPGSRYGMATQDFGTFPADLGSIWSSYLDNDYPVYADLCAVSTFTPTPTKTWTPSLTPTLTHTPSITPTWTPTGCTATPSTPVVSASSDVPKSILDASTVSSTLEVTGAPTIVADVNVSVNISHTFKGDLIVWIESPEGRSVTLHNRSGGDANDIVTTYDTWTAPEGPGSLDDYRCRPADGTWTLRVRDAAAPDTGTLNSWSLELR